MMLRPLRLVIILLFLFISADSIAQYSLNSPVILDPNVKMGKLPNGLTYYIRKNAMPEKKVELRLVVNAGSILEDNDQQGLAHFMEHMNFNGSKHFPKNELVDYLQKVGVQFGADLNAYTGFDETVYILPIASDNPKTLEQGFTVVEDWAGNNLMDKGEIEKERGVVLEESRLSKGADERMQRIYFPKIFNGSKYATRLPIGKDSIIKTFKPEVLERFYRQWYRPDLMAVIVVGDIDPAVAEQKIKEHFSGLKNPPIEKQRPAMTEIKPRTSPQALVVTDDEQVSSDLEIFNFIRPAKTIKTWGDYRQKIVEDLMTTLINQRLQELAQKENPPFVYGFTGNIGFLRGYDVFVSYAVLGNGGVKDAANALMAEVQRARQFGFLQSEVDRAKAALLNGAQNSFNEKDKSESGKLVQPYINNFLMHEPTPGAEAHYNFIKQILPGITTKEINDVAKKMPTANNSFALLLAPSKTKDKLPSNSELLKDVVSASKQTVQPYKEKAVANNLMNNGPATGKVVKETKNEKLGTTDLTLNNGITITIKPTTYKNDEIKMDAWRKGGYSNFSLAEKNNAKHAAEVVDEMGVKDLSPTDLRKFLSGKTIEVTPYINEDEDGINGSSSVKDFETLLQMINLYFTQPRKDAGLFKSYISKQKVQFQFLKSNPAYFFQDSLSKIIYDHNPWAETVPSEEEYSHIDLDRSFEIYKSIFGNAYGMHFTFAGNIDPATAKPLLEKYLGSLPSAEKQNVFKDNGVRPVKGVVEANIKKGKEAQSAIVVLFSGEAEYSSQELLIVNALTNALNIKITEKLREEMSGVYTGGISGGLKMRPYPHYTLQAVLPCGPENVDKLTAALFDIIKNAQTNGIDQTTLDKVKETLKKQYETAMQTNDLWVTTLANSWINGTNPENLLSYESRLNALTTQDLQKAAKKYFNMNNYVKAVLYPENAKVQDGVIKKPL